MMKQIKQLFQYPSIDDTNFSHVYIYIFIYRFSWSCYRFMVSITPLTCFSVYRRHIFTLIKGQTCVIVDEIYTNYLLSLCVNVHLCRQYTSIVMSFHHYSAFILSYFCAFLQVFVYCFDTYILCFLSFCFSTSSCIYTYFAFIENEFVYIYFIQSFLLFILFLLFINKEIHK